MRLINVEINDCLVNDKGNYCFKIVRVKPFLSTVGNKGSEKIYYFDCGKNLYKFHGYRNYKIQINEMKNYYEIEFIRNKYKNN